LRPPSIRRAEANAPAASEDQFDYVSLDAKIFGAATAGEELRKNEEIDGEGREKLERF